MGSCGRDGDGLERRESLTFTSWGFRRKVAETKFRNNQSLINVISWVEMPGETRVGEYGIGH